MKRVKKVLKNIISVFLKKGLGYTIVVALMCMCFIAYPSFLQEKVYEYLQPRLDVKLYSRVMELIPLVWISLVGLVVSWFNTVIYCIFDIDGLKKGWRAFYVFSGIFIIVWIVFICCEGYFEAKSLLTYGDGNNPEEMLEGIFKVFQSFTRGVAWLTVATFALFAIIDSRDLVDTWLKRKRSSDIEEKAELLIDLRSSRLQLLLIDATVLLSSGMLWWFSGHIDYSVLSLRMVQGDFYTNIFMTGAWGIQIIISQLVFYFLTMLYYYEKQSVEKVSKVKKKSKKRRIKGFLKKLLKPLRRKNQ